MIDEDDNIETWLSSNKGVVASHTFLKTIADNLKNNFLKVGQRWIIDNP